MSKTDFQNGFALGMASGGVVDVEDTSKMDALENLIDESGVLDSTEGTATEKVEQLIDKAQWENVWYEQSGKWTKQFASMFAKSTIKKIPKLNFENATDMSYFLLENQVIESVDYYINSGKATNFNSAFTSWGNLNFIYGVDTSSATNLSYVFGRNPLLETIQEPLNFSKATSLNNCFIGCAELKNIRFVENSIKLSLQIASSPLLSAESTQSIIDGLATVETAQTLTLSSTVFDKLTDEQLSTIAAKNWLVA